MSLIPTSFWKAKGGIVTQDLIMYYDANDPASFTSGASPWLDLTTENNDSTMFDDGSGKPLLDSAGGGNAYFLKAKNHWSQVFLNGVNGSTPPLYSVEIWMNIVNTPTGTYFPVTFGDSYGAVYLSAGFGYNTFNGDLYGIDSTEVSASGMIGNFRQYVFVVNQSVSYTNNKIYINSTNKTLSQVQGSENATNRSFATNGQFTMNGFGSFREDMKVSIVRIYDRELTSSEVLQNYNAEKSRFGL